MSIDNAGAIIIMITSVYCICVINQCMLTCCCIVAVIETQHMTMMIVKPYLF